MTIPSHRAHQPANDSPVAWRMSVSTFLSALGVHEPWIAEISAVQLARMSERERTAYREQRAREWSASSEAKNEWRRQIIMAFDAGSIALPTEGLHPDARTVILWEQTARAKIAYEARLKTLREASAIDTIEQLKVGDNVWNTLFRAFVLVIRLHRVSVDVKGPRGIARVHLATRQLQRLSPEQIEIEARRPAGRESESAPKPATNDGDPKPEPLRARHELGPGAIVQVESAPKPAVIEEQSTTMGDDSIRVEIVDAHTQLVRVGAIALPMRTDFEDGAPRMRDEDFAAWLGYERPRKARELIGRLVKSGKLRDVCCRPTTGRQPTNGGGEREYIVNEFWLTRREALLVATQSDTLRAWQMTELIVSVFEAVMHGAVPVPVAGLSMDSVRQIIAATVSACMEPVRASLHAEVESLRSDMQSANASHRALASGMAGSAAARELLARITRAAHQAAGAGVGSFRKLRKEYEDRVRDHVGFPQERAHRWANLPIDRLAEARIAVERIEREAEGHARVHFAESQRALPLQAGARS